MIAYACEPHSTSEGLVGWELASRIARETSRHFADPPEGAE